MPELVKVNHNPFEQQGRQFLPVSGNPFDKAKPAIEPTIDYNPEESSAADTPLAGLTFDSLKKGLKTGALDMAAGMLGFLESTRTTAQKLHPGTIIDRALGLKPDLTKDQPLTQSIAWFRKTSADLQPEYDRGTPEFYAYNAINSMTQNIPPLVLGIATGSQAAALFTMGASVAGQKYNELIGRGFSHEKASLIGGMYGAAEAIGEKIPLGHYMKAFQLKRAILGSLMEIPGEMVTEVLQAGIDRGFLLEKEPFNLDRFIDTLIVTGITAPFMGASARIAAKAGQKYGLKHLTQPMQNLVEEIPGQQPSVVTDIYTPDVTPAPSSLIMPEKIIQEKRTTATLETTPTNEPGKSELPKGTTLEQHEKGSQVLDPNKDIGAIILTIRGENARNPLQMVLNKEGKMVTKKEVLSDNESNGTAWIPENAERAEAAREIITRRQNTKPGTPERKLIDDELRKFVTEKTSANAPQSTKQIGETYYTGLKGNEFKPNKGSNVIQLSQKADVAEQYAGKNGTQWEVSASDKTKVLDTRNSEELNKLKSDLFDDYESGKLDLSFDELIEQNGKPKAKETISKLIDEMNPDEIVTSAGAWDNPDIAAWIYDRYGFDMVKTKNGAIVIDPSKVEYKPLSQPPQSTKQGEAVQEPSKATIEQQGDKWLVKTGENEYLTQGKRKKVNISFDTENGAQAMADQINKERGLTEEVRPPEVTQPVQSYEEFIKDAEQERASSKRDINSLLYGTEEENVTAETIAETGGKIDWETFRSVTESQLLDLKGELNEYRQSLIDERKQLQKQAKEAQKEVDKNLAVFLQNKIDRTSEALKSIKQKIREATGQVRTDDHVVTEMAALNEAMRQAEKASRAAYSAGNKRGALTEYERMKSIEIMKRVRQEAQRETRNLKKYLEKAGKDKTLRNIDPEYRTAVKSALNFDGNAVELFMLKEMDNGDMAFIAEDQIEALKNVNEDNVTLDDLRNQASVVKQLIYQGRRKRQIFIGKERFDRRALIDDIELEVRQENKTEAKTVEQIIQEDYLLGVSKDQRGKMTKAKEILDSVLSNLRKAKYIFNNLVAYKENSLLMKATFDQMAESEKTEINLGTQTAQMLKDAFANIREQLQSGEINRPIEIAGIRTTKFNAITIALNSGNEGNRRALREGSKGVLTDERIDAIKDSLTPQEMAFVKGIWAILEYQRPFLQKAYKELTGENMTLVEGQYYPLIFDENLASVITDKQQEQDLFRLYGYVTTVAKGFTMQRKGTGQPPTLDFMKVIDHIQNVNHFIAYGKTVRDVNRIINDKQFRDMAVEHIGDAQYKQLRPWLKGIANPHYETMNGWDKVMQKMRNNAAVAIMGFSLSTSLLQPTAAAQAINRLGLGTTIKGFRDFYSDPFTLKEFIYSVSPFMQMRTSNFDATIQEMMAGDKSALWKDNRMKQMYFSLMSMTDKMTSLPVWYAAYSQQLEKTGDQEGSIKFADSLVAETQSSGMPKDLAEVQRGNATRKAFVMFYSYFSSTYNEAVRSVDLVKHGKIGAMDLMKSYWWLFAVPALFQGLLKAAAKGKEPEEYPVQIAKELAGYASGTLPVVGSVINSVTDGFEFRPSPVVNLPVEIAKGIKSMTSDRAFYGRGLPSYMRHGWMAAGYALGLPARQTLLLADEVWVALHKNEVGLENLFGLVYSQRGNKKGR